MNEQKNIAVFIVDPRPENAGRCRDLLARMQSCLPGLIGATIHVADIERGKDAYSRFVALELAARMPKEATHAMVVQLDGYITNPECWDDEFLAHDYIGAPWPIALNPDRVGNGGFSIRSRRLQEWIARQQWAELPEDVFICSHCRSRIIEAGMTFAPLELAARFSRELPIEEAHLVPRITLGFHGWGHESPNEPRFSDG
jgi:hypothetical protein